MYIYIYVHIYIYEIINIYIYINTCTHAYVNGCGSRNGWAQSSCCDPQCWPLFDPEDLNDPEIKWNK